MLKRWYITLIAIGLTLNTILFGWMYRRRLRSRAAQSAPDRSPAASMAPAPQPDRLVARPIIPSPPPLTPRSHYGIHGALLFTSFEVPAVQP